MQFVIYLKSTPVLTVCGISDSGYSLHTNEDEALTFPTEEAALSASLEIPNSEPEFWGVRPKRRKDK